ncbi:MAG: HD domain-containing protein [Phycisphaerales bacterium]|nr:HD domain-containing protein [Phycisphaerales bacterium]
MEATLWQRAASFAARAHAGGLRKDGCTPYVAHPFRVAMTVRHVFGCDDDVAIAAALLHDTIEDTATDYDEIHEHFGARVADCVAALTKNKSLPEGEREAAYDAHLARGPWQARLVKLADVYDNTIDRTPRTPQTAEKMGRLRARALRLAAADADRPEVARAIEAVRALG